MLLASSFTTSKICKILHNYFSIAVVYVIMAIAFLMPQNSIFFTFRNTLHFSCFMSLWTVMAGLVSSFEVNLIGFSFRLLPLPHFPAFFFWRIIFPVSSYPFSSKCHQQDSEVLEEVNSWQNLEPYWGILNVLREISIKYIKQRF